jgi:hypothetical protein
LEAGIVTLRKDIQKKNMKNNSKFLNDIISSQRPNHEKSRLGYNQTKKGSSSKATEEETYPKSYAETIKGDRKAYKRKLQGHSSTEKIQISESMTDRNRYVSGRRMIHKRTSFHKIFKSQVSNYFFWFVLCM